MTSITTWLGNGCFKSPVPSIHYNMVGFRLPGIKGRVFQVVVIGSRVFCSTDLEGKHARLRGIGL